MPIEVKRNDGVTINIDDEEPDGIRHFRRSDNKRGLIYPGKLDDFLVKFKNGQDDKPARNQLVTNSPPGETPMPLPRLSFSELEAKQQQAEAVRLGSWLTSHHQPAEQPATNINELPMPFPTFHFEKAKR